jgi:rhamnose utilization protein RhaD (predicted bifunctional aldolase and dehydrogenase)/NAD(P)-dependent dehydrogenase (short-subunit alcohol dehydrogenase family)
VKSSLTIARCRSRWQDAEALRWSRSVADRQLGLRIYTSRLLGAEPGLVLHGGGNTSLKSILRTLSGEERRVLWIKGSGMDLAVAGEQSFAALDAVATRGLVDLEALSDRDMVRELRRLRFDPDGPSPSVETLLHAFLPHRFVDHTHADAVLAVLASADGPARAEELWGEDHLIVPYVQPGFELAVKVRQAWLDHGDGGLDRVGVVLLHHGIVSFADTARESYERMIATVDRAYRHVSRRRIRASAAPAAAARARRTWRREDLAALRAAVSAAAGRPLLACFDGDLAARRAAGDRSLARALCRGAVTPDHALRTRLEPLRVASPRQIQQAVTRYAARAGKAAERHRSARRLVKLDPAPRVALLDGWGTAAFGPTVVAARQALEISSHARRVVAAAEGLGGFRPLSRRQLLEVEAWELEQAKLKLVDPAPPLTGRVALVSGAARGIGRAAVEALLEAGAAVVGLDLRAIEMERPEFVGVVGDATQAAVIETCLDRAVERFGGVDILVSNVGYFPASAAIEELDRKDLARAFEVNAASHAMLWRAAAPLLRCSPVGGSIIVVASRNVLAPGAGAAAYSASKAALTQLARVAALEMAPHGVRVNVLHPDNVFDTDLWTPELLAARAARYGLSVEQYKSRNLLRREVRARDVANAIVALAGDTFRCTTGAQIPLDGGSDRVI